MKLLPLARERVRVVGVDCPTCVLAIQKSLSKIGASMDIDISTGEAVVVYDASKISLADVSKAIREAGYDLEKASLTFSVELEPEEAPSFEKKVSRLRGVFTCNFSPASGLARITYNPLTAAPREIIEGVRSLGYLVREVQEVERGAEREKPLWAPLLSFSLGLFAVVYHSLEAFRLAPLLPAPVLPVIATLVILLNLDLIARGLRSLARLAPTMESLVALSSLVAYTAGVAMLLGQQGGGMFEVPAGVLGFVSAGKYVEDRMRRRALEHLHALASSQAGKVRVLRNGRLEVVEADEVKPGEVVEVRAGERILVDGVVVEGWGYVDESTFTGEPTPAFKGAERRDVVLSGSVLISGFLKVRATRVGRDTSLAHIVEAVREAQFYKPRFQRLADRVVGYLTWAVVALSAAVFLYWATLGGASINEAALFAASVLAVTCPCPLGIAVPLVVAIATINAARLGVLVRRGDVFERVLAVDTVIFDKTGTLTVGRPAVQEVVVLDSGAEGVLKYVCSAEYRSEHPLAAAVREYCSERGVELVEPESYEHFPGLGVAAKVDGVEVVVGSRRLVEAFVAQVPQEAERKAAGEARRGATVFYVAVGGRVSALVVVRDRVREGAAGVVSFFREKGIRTILATGDSRGAAESISAELGIEEVRAELRPEDKAELVEELQQQGRKVLFVGDGVNDAAAMSKAFVGVAMGSGADISKGAGDAVLTSSNLESLLTLYGLSALVRRKALQNLAWAFTYNLALVPIAAGALWKALGLMLRPELAAAAMMASDISVVVNALSMLRWRPARLTGEPASEPRSV
uniref:Heavy metal translocating P-type ATPase n=1 Tax=Thermofilum pendens TaxID=2269 RepID=A0A7C4BAI8_THEPE